MVAAGVYLNLYIHVYPTSGPRNAKTGWTSVIFANCATSRRYVVLKPPIEAPVVYRKMGGPWSKAYPAEKKVKSRSITRN